MSLLSELVKFYNSAYGTNSKSNNTLEYNRSTYFYLFEVEGNREIGGHQA